MLITNIYGVVMAAIAIAPGAIAMQFGPKKVTVFVLMLCGAALSIAADILLRKSRQEISAKYFHPKAGGHVFFVPSWIVAIVWAVFLTFVYMK